jgi:hypothetical protein
MSQLGVYSFLPWLRQGVANHLTAADGDPLVKLRAELHVELTLSGDAVGGGAAVAAKVARDVALFGPGDVVGIDPRAIVRVEPRPWTTNLEPNYLAQVEFYDEDFPWRYTPAAPEPAHGRLRPWIALVVLTEAEFRDGADLLGRPLPYVVLTDEAVLPDAGRLWAWAHVHVNRDLTGADDEIVTGDMAAALPRLQGVLEENPDLAFSRLICPRKLGPDTAYHAFVIPVFESGRLAGLGVEDLSVVPFATHSAWEEYEGRPEGGLMPYYHRWFFRTGAKGDFESLVRLLKPMPVDHRVGTRDMEVLHPGSGLPPIDDPALAGVLKLGGALRVPHAAYTAAEREEAERYDRWAEPYPRPFQAALARRVDLADDYAAQAAEAANAAAGITSPPEADPAGEPVADPDPLVTPPLYGAWHALTRRLLLDRDGEPLHPDDNWVHELNLDPRHRVAAGLGTRVVQAQQERLMSAAWEQVGDVLEANRRIRLGQLALLASSSLWTAHLVPLYEVAVEKLLLLTAPVAPRVRAGDFTVRHHLAQGRVQPALASAAARRMLRPRGRLLRTAARAAQVQPGSLLARVNAAEVSAAPPPPRPAVTTLDAVADRVLAASGVPAWAHAPLRARPWLRFVPPALAALAVVVLALVAAPAVALAGGIAAAGAGAAAFRAVTRWERVVRASDGLREAAGAAAIDALPTPPGFALASLGQAPPRGGSVAEAVRFKQALRESADLVAESAAAGTASRRAPVDLSGLAEATVRALDPRRTVRARTLGSVRVPSRLREEVGEAFVEVMAYPVFDEPMYKPLVVLSSELFLPNIDLVQQNSITLLETNQRFIEAYLVGLNHELARELLWREYPTDQRGSYFRQFWDVAAQPPLPGETPEAARERLRDVPPLHRWPRHSALGGHDQREAGGDAEEEVVLVIRGELLKRYPNAVIYAQRARWNFADGQIDPTRERELVELTPEEEAAPPRAKLRMPLYEAKVEPDIYFLGFDLTAEVAKGGTGAQPTDDPGWFFVLRERPGEPRFGLDVEEPSQRRARVTSLVGGIGPGAPKHVLEVWNDLSWAEVQPGAPGTYIPAGTVLPAPELTEPDSSENNEKQAQHDEDMSVPWNAGMSSADLAYILFQAPMMVAVHAGDLLKST